MNKRLLCIVSLLALNVSVAFTQTLDDYRTIASGTWTNIAIWERYDGSNWVAAATAPDNTKGLITVRAPHIISMPGGTLDQVVVDSGATVNQAGWVQVVDGPGADLQINGTWNYASGYLYGPGTSEVNGTFNWENGEIGAPGFVTPAFSRVIINSGGIFNMNTTAIKLFNRGGIINSGTINWNAGDIHLNGIVGTDTARIENSGTVNIGSGTLNIFGQSTLFKTFSSGTINKATTGTVTTMQGTIFITEGLLHVSNGTFSTNNQNASFHNHGTIRTTGSGTFNGQWNVNLYTGSLITGNGTFIANGSVQIRGSAVVDTGSTLTQNGGYVIGPGPLIVNGTYLFTAGEIGGPSFVNSAFTVARISPGGVLELSGSAQKFFNRAQVSSQGTVNWNAGEWHLHSVAGPDTTWFVNHATLNIGAGTLNLFGQSPARFINLATGTVNKHSTGTTTTMQGTYFINEGLLNISNGTFSTNNQNASFHNYGTINTTGSGTFNGQWNVNLYAGSLITGNGTIIANGSVQIRGSAVVDTGSTLTQNGGYIIGPGPLIVNGTYLFTAGEIGGPSFVNSAFTVVNISPGGVLELTGSAQKFFNRAQVTNQGTVNWNAGEWHLYSVAGPDTTWFVNHATLNIGASTLNLFSQSPARFINTANGIVNKHSTGTVTTMQGTFFINRGLLHISNGTFSTNNQNASFHNYGTINTTGSGTFNGQWNVNLYTGSLFTGNGIVNFNGNVHAAGLGVVDTGCTVNLVGGLLAGPGPFTVRGTLNWTGGKMGDFWWPKTNIAVEPEGILELNGPTLKELAKAVLTNKGTINWNAGDWALTTTVVPDTCILFNEGTINLNAGALNWNDHGNGNTHIRNMAGGEIVKATNTTTTIQSQSGPSLRNEGTIRGIGTLVVNADFASNGIISPGLSPGMLTMNGQNSLSAGSNLLIELQDGSGAGTGHDLLQRNANLTISGKLTAVETGLVPNGTYTIVNLTSGAVADTFVTLDLPPFYTVGYTTTTAFLTKYKFFTSSLDIDLCEPDSFVLNNKAYTASGTYVDTIPSVEGFDSIITLNLTMHPALAVNVSQTGATLTATGNASGYQWLDCSNNFAPIAGATSASFTATQNGQYAVQISNPGCTDTTTCFTVTGVGISIANPLALKAYPVPVSNVLTIELPFTSATVYAEVLNMAGSVVATQFASGSRILEVDFSALPKSVYMVRIHTGQEVQVIRVVVK